MEQNVCLEIAKKIKSEKERKKGPDKLKNKNIN